MKILIAILCVLILISCHKEDRPTKSKQLVLVEDDFGVTKGLRTTGRGPKKNRPPDTVVVVTPDPPSYTGQRLIHIDADGEQVNSAWGNFYATPSSLTASQVSYVVDSGRIALSFNTNLTLTADVASYNLCPTNYRQKVILTEYYEWYGYAGGVAYVYSFGTETPCFVFTALFGGNVKNVAHATIHEAGHTLGLRHTLSTSVWNYMGAGYNNPYHIFESNAQTSAGVVDQFSVMNNTLQ